ncbi:hypothetical protein Poli38472_014078 [Pythium oligandrum]|uniref:Uncharacterized protein n=1 Tax=Pythium oligandrum TaxID=41045 RepID=A0A8K1FL48_PYTOL|nr:hypothetical protein Poli38472_014078 [Pythium oligandrum]|eukprot:TMW66766.1 hypothetical protein Poli38472_014078 [Pythium oligandrum]
MASAAVDMRVPADERGVVTETKRRRRSAGGARKRVAFTGAEYIEYDSTAAPVVRRAGVGRVLRRSPASATEGATPPPLECADREAIALEWQARRPRGLRLGRQKDDDLDEEAKHAAVIQQYEDEMREMIESRGLPCFEEDVADLPLQLRITELLVAWAAVADLPEDKTLDPKTSFDKHRRQLELCRKHVFGPVVDGYAFGRRFFSIESYLGTLELEELAELAEARGLTVPELTPEERDAVKVTERELIAIFSPTGVGKQLKALTFRELVEEAYARGIDVDEIPDNKQKRSKRAWVDRLRPIVAAEMKELKLREAQSDLLFEQLLSVMEEAMQATQLSTIHRLIQLHLSASDTSRSELSREDMAMNAAVARYFRHFQQWYQDHHSG